MLRQHMLAHITLLLNTHSFDVGCEEGLGCVLKVLQGGRVSMYRVWRRWQVIGLSYRSRCRHAGTSQVSSQYRASRLREGSQYPFTCRPEGGAPVQGVWLVSEILVREPLG